MKSLSARFVVLAFFICTNASLVSAQDSAGEGESQGEAGSLQNDFVAVPVEENQPALADDTSFYPQSFSQRPLTMRRGMVRGNAIFTVWDDGVDTNTGLDIGGAVSVHDDVEIGINNYRTGSSLQHKYEGLITAAFTPDASFGDIPVYGRYRFLQRDKVQMAADLVFVLPSNTAFALETDLPIRILVNKRVSVDTGAEVRGTFGSFKRADVRLPAIVNFNISERAYIAGETGWYFINLGKKLDNAPADMEGMAFPASFRAGGTWKRQDKDVVDLFAGFAFPNLIETGTSRKTVDFGIWDIFVGFVWNTHSLF
jgi:hypothetical protein